jgi:hypothetical protein
MLSVVSLSDQLLSGHREHVKRRDPGGMRGYGTPAFHDASKYYMCALMLVGSNRSLTPARTYITPNTITAVEHQAGTKPRNIPSDSLGSDATCR